MKFLIHIPQLIYGGAEKVLVSFANDLVGRGHQVEILETYEKGLLKSQFDPKVTFHAICSNAYTKKYYASLNEVKKEKHPLRKLKKLCKLSFSKLVGYRRFAEKLAEKHYREEVFDAAINYLEIESPDFILNRIQAKKKIQWVHTDVSEKSVQADLREFILQYEKIDHIFCVSSYAAEQFRKTYPQLSDQTTVLYNFFEVEAIQKRGETAFRYHADCPVLLSVGRMTAPKSYFRFLDVLKRLKDEGIPFQWNVLGEGVEKPKITEKIKALGLTEQVHLMGLADNPYPYMKGCDLFVLPSSWEGFPTVTIEAKLMGCPVLATDVSGIREQLVHGKTGWIVENSEDAIYEGLKFLLTHPEEAEKLRDASSIAPVIDEERKYREFMKYM